MMQPQRGFSYTTAVSHLESALAKYVYGSFSKLDVTFDSLLNVISEMCRTSMSYKEHRKFYPLTDELLVYLEECSQEKGVNHYASVITA